VAGVARWRAWRGGGRKEAFPRRQLINRFLSPLPQPGAYGLFGKTGMTSFYIGGSPLFCDREQHVVKTMFFRLGQRTKEGSLGQRTKEGKSLNLS
jgi:hypothetical protein